MILSSKKILSMNLKFYRQYFNLSQEKFAEKIGSNLVYINQLENCKRKPTTDMLDKLANGINKLDKSLNITASDLLKYDPSHKTNFNRIDEKKYLNYFFYFARKN
jgi:transcriptional regulator with XRE-family HTH domain